MKKMITMLAVGAVVAVASADLTSFAWQGGVATDQNGAAIAAGAEMTTVTVDLSGLIVAGQIDIAALTGATAYSVDAIGVAPAFLGGTYSTGNIDGSNTINGGLLPMVYGVLKNGTGAFAVGDYIALTGGFQTIDLQPGTDPASPAQNFAAGDLTTNVQVVGIPEPATLGLMGIAGLGMFLARKKAQR